MIKGDKIVRAHIFVSGVVQGVFFRASVAEKARNLDLSGWIKNLDDGRVEIIFEGSEERIKKMVFWIRSEPGMWRIKDIQIEWQSYKEDFNNFEIRR
ncbi:MAG TPA: acylphosphatase [Candidatus Parcubacteria bacterium]|nr:acylphosphatase [Candidatus Parcubacteria bacterium]